jgi:hypothetical protein
MRNNQPIPPKFKPGALLESLSPEERKALVSLTSDKARSLALRPEFVG